MGKKLVIICFAFLLALVFYGRAEATQYALHIVHDYAPYGGIDQAHVILRDLNGTPIFNDLTDPQGWIHYNASYHQVLFYEVSKDCFDTIVGQMVAGVTLGLQLHENGCPPPPQYFLRALDDRGNPQNPWPIQQVFVEILEADGTPVISGPTDANGYYYFSVPMGTYVYRMSRNCYNTVSGTFVPGVTLSVTMHYTCGGPPPGGKIKYMMQEPE